MLLNWLNECVKASKEKGRVHTVIMNNGFQMRVKFIAADETAVLVTDTKTSEKLVVFLNNVSTIKMEK